MGLLADVFGISGSGVDFFGGQWWMLGFFIIFIFAVYFYSSGFSGEAMSLWIFAAVILVTIDTLFEIPSDWIIIAILFIVILFSFAVNKFLRG